MGGKKGVKGQYYKNLMGGGHVEKTGLLLKVNVQQKHNFDV